MRTMMTDNVHDLTERAARYAQHVTALARAFGVALIVQHDMDPAAATAGFLRSSRGLPFDLKQRVVVIAPVRDESTYAVALHELGHCIHPLGQCTQTEGSREMRLTNQYSTERDVRLQLLEERSAWEWAHHYALEWTPVMQAVEDLGMQSYLRMARRFGVKEG